MRPWSLDTSSLQMAVNIMRTNHCSISVHFRWSSDATNLCSRMGTSSVKTSWSANSPHLAYLVRAPACNVQGSILTNIWCSSGRQDWLRSDTDRLGNVWLVPYLLGVFFCGYRTYFPGRLVWMDWQNLGSVLEWVHMDTDDLPWALDVRIQPCEMT